MNQDIVPLIVYAGVVFGLFYILFIAPQRRQRRQMADMLAALAPGDEVVTAGGIYGSVRSMEEEAITVEIADGVAVRVAKSAIVARTGGGKTEE